jgi:hypothetical protein
MKGIWEFENGFKLDLRAEARLSEREFLEVWASRIFLMSEREFFRTIISEPERAKLVIGIAFYKSLRKWCTNVIKLQLSFKNETNRWKWKIRVTFKFGTGRTTCSTWTRTGCHCVYLHSSMSLPLIHGVTSVFYIFYAYIIWICRVTVFNHRHYKKRQTSQPCSFQIEQTDFCPW